VKFYLSNIRPAWSFERQEKVLDAKAPGWRGGAVYRDTLSAARRKAHGAAYLTQRAMALRPSSRPDGGEFAVATLAILDWTVKGLLAVLAACAANRMTLVSVECGTRVPPNDVAAAGEAVAEFERAIRRTGDAKKSGGMVSGERRKLVADAACEAARPYWGLPTKEYTIAWISKQFDVSRPKLTDYLGPRKEAQARHKAGLKTAESNRARAERRNQRETE
jgi:hypothetical protein